MLLREMEQLVEGIREGTEGRGVLATLEEERGEEREEGEEEVPREWLL